MNRFSSILKYSSLISSFNDQNSINKFLDKSLVKKVRLEIWKPINVEVILDKIYYIKQYFRK